jgi:ligand-binding SRPBCC domain-containing protein
MIDIAIRTKLSASRAQVWSWITSVDGISKEMRPYLRMTTPKNLPRIVDVKTKLGEVFLHSRVFLFGFIPGGSWHFVLTELTEQDGFVEQSPSTFMKSWRHERRIVDDPSDPSAVILSDHVTFAPKLGAWLSGRFLRHVFAHRHRVLQKHFTAALVRARA